MRLYAAETAQISATDSAPGGPTTAASARRDGRCRHDDILTVSTPSAQTAGTAFDLTIGAKDTFGNGPSGPQTITFSGVSSSPNGTAPELSKLRGLHRRCRHGRRDAVHG